MKKKKHGKKKQQNIRIWKSEEKTSNTINMYDRVAVSLSGGRDSDTMLKLIIRLVKEGKITAELHYIFFDTGLEYKATKKHLTYLEKKYKITIERVPIKWPIPRTIFKHGQPFFSKHVSEMMSRLQRYNFDWVDKPFDVLYPLYPKCKSALEWWCQEHKDGSFFNVSNVMKEFIIINNPWFPISAYCCVKAKKNPSKEYAEEHDIQLMIVGLRQVEGGLRKARHKECYSETKAGYDLLLPIFWYTDADRLYYEHIHKIKNSKCYTKYQLERTGCAGCPYGREFEYEVKVVKKFEPRLYKAIHKLFGDSYKYTRMYNRYKDSGDV